MEFSTGLPGLDEVLTGVHPGDNVVWQVERIGDYAPFVDAFCREACRQGRELVYFRFAEHPALLPEDVRARVYTLHPEDGFENFISEIFDVIEKTGVGACYVFDSLSELTVDWYSDRMLGNFFMLACPYLYAFDTVAYFGLLANHHTAHAVDAIHKTAQVVLDVYRNRDDLFVQPVKVWKRHSSTMYTVHAWQGDRFVPVTRSAVIAELLTSVPQPWLHCSVNRRDVWTHVLSQAQEQLDRAGGPGGAAEPDQELRRRLLRMMFTRDPQLIALAELHLSLRDLVDIGKRMIGTGLIGGKSAGMLLARSILKRSDPAWSDRLEAHDSFYVGSDVFYTYVILNDCWWVRRKVKHAPVNDLVEEGRRRMLSGSFPKDIQDQFMEMLQYFGQSPIIVRSSSLLEDAYGNAFSGKYESVFCANQGTPQQRLDDFKAAVRTVYASTLSRDALSYRAHWGLLDRDEQMALLVQRVSGDVYGDKYFPQVAGVGYSWNPFVWSPHIEPRAGMLRLVFGLGTRAVDRSDDDYTRIVSLSAPERRPEGSFDEVRSVAQRNVDGIDLHANAQRTWPFQDAAKDAGTLPLHVFATRDTALEDRARDTGRDVFSWVLTFDELLTRGAFVPGMRDLLQTLETAYGKPVDVEFAAGFLDERGADLRINLLQCRPLQIRGKGADVKLPADLRAQDVLLRSRGPVIGNSRAVALDRILYVVPQIYSRLPTGERHAVARLVGQIAHMDVPGVGEHKPVIMLIGPGRWGTRSPELGVPVSFAQIETVSVLCEVAEMHEGLVPDVSLGTHFFNDLVEMDMLYLAVYPNRDGHLLNRDVLAGSAVSAAELLGTPGVPAADAIRVLDAERVRRAIHLHASAVDQRAVCYF